ncbi:MAG: hypothetical protein JJU30_13735 [Alkalimonas sp.]|nr:hypothetical protein [Alkalimonas sp.]
MKFNTPITTDQHKQADAEYADLIKSQREALYSIAEKLKHGEKLSSFEKEIAAAVIKGAATNMSEIRPRPTGKPPKLPGELAVEFGVLVVFKEYSNNKALEALAQKYQVSDTAVKKHLGLAGTSRDAIARKKETLKFLSSMQQSKLQNR